MVDDLLREFLVDDRSYTNLVQYFFLKVFVDGEGGGRHERYPVIEGVILGHQSVCRILGLII